MPYVSQCTIFRVKAECLAFTVCICRHECRGETAGIGHFEIKFFERLEQIRVCLSESRYQHWPKDHIRNIHLREGQFGIICFMRSSNRTWVYESHTMDGEA